MLVKFKGYYILFFIFLGVAGAVYAALSNRFTGPIEYISPRLFKEEEKKNVPPPVLHLKTPNPVRGIYMTSWVAGTTAWREELVGFVKKTEINSIVIDVKDYSGRVAFETEEEKINEAGSEEIRINDLPGIISRMHQDGIYVIARITVFQDPFYAKRHPELAVQQKNGALWEDRKGLSYIDPGAKEFWDYIVAISRASERAGFDELNYDYIRFPSDGNISDIVFPHSQNRAKPDVLDDFFSYLKANLKTGENALSVPLSADVFGMTMTNMDDLGIGQVLERVDKHFDYTAPMVYPSHYPPTFLGFKNPALYPYEIVLHAMKSGTARLTAATSSPSRIRPWLQDFDLGAQYDASMVRLQKKAVYDAGLDSWMIWDPANKYTRGAYDLEEE